MASKKSAEPEPLGGLLELVDRVMGKESSMTVDLDEVGVDMGNGRRLVLNGKVHVNVSTLK
ncbi:MAG: hypothetical protein HY558_02600 [Euryarchaeota archaeon]|nr:hypothetical protein [Euryarchaeota archaeon]